MLNLNSSLSVLARRPDLGVFILHSFRVRVWVVLQIEGRKIYGETAVEAQQYSHRLMV